MHLTRNVRRSGFTLLEVTIALVIVALIGINISMVMKTSTSAYESGLIQGELEDRASLTMDRIRLALMSSSLEDLNPELSEGLHSSHIRYCVSLGLDEEGELVLADPEQIALEDAAGQVVWKQNLDLENERSVVWTKDVPELFRDELLNGIDDNGNGLLDEKGLFFAQSGKNVEVELTLERTDSKGQSVLEDRKLTVTCRN